MMGRVKIVNFTLDFAWKLYENSYDEDMKRFLPDEIINSIDEAYKRIEHIMFCYNENTSPFVYALVNENDEYIGYILLCEWLEGYEIGYHINSAYTGKGYATEAVRLFIPYIMSKLEIDKIYGITDEDNISSARVLEKSGFQLFFKGKGKYQGNECDIRKYIYKKAD